MDHGLQSVEIGLTMIPPEFLAFRYGAAQILKDLAYYS
jgi:hypothetical protein